MFELLNIPNWLEAHLLPCPIKSLTGHECPGCGMQRALVSLLKGNIAESIHYHPAAIPTLIMLIFMVVHIKFRFRSGARILLIMYLVVAVVTMIHYLYKTFAPTG